MKIKTLKISIILFIIIILGAILFIIQNKATKTENHTVQNKSDYNIVGEWFAYKYYDDKTEGSLFWMYLTGVYNNYSIDFKQDFTFRKSLVLANNIIIDETGTYEIIDDIIKLLFDNDRVETIKIKKYDSILELEMSEIAEGLSSDTIIVCFRYFDEIISLQSSLYTDLDNEINPDKDRACMAYLHVLENDKEFIDNNKSTYLKSYYLDKFSEDNFSYDEIKSRLKFAIVDMDGDGIPEVVLDCNSTIRTILRYENGTVYGYFFGIRGLNRIKKDGTFSWAGSAGYNGYGKIEFTDGNYKSIDLGYRDNNDYHEPTNFYIDNIEVTENEYNVFVKIQDEKKDVEWYKFSEENIEIKLYMRIGI